MTDVTFENPVKIQLKQKYTCSIPLKKTKGGTSTGRSQPAWGLKNVPRKQLRTWTEKAKNRGASMRGYRGK
jgi:hypothetical protein